MPGRSMSTSDKARNCMYTLEVLDILSHTKDAMTISDICANSFTLNGLSTSKMAHILKTLIDAGLVRKTQSKSKKRMVYMSVQQMEDMGITLNNE